MPGLLSEDPFEGPADRPLASPLYGQTGAWPVGRDDLAFKFGADLSPAMRALATPPVEQVGVSDFLVRLLRSLRLGSEMAERGATQAAEDAARRASGRRPGTLGIVDAPLEPRPSSPAPTAGSESLPTTVPPTPDRVPALPWGDQRVPPLRDIERQQAIVQGDEALDAISRHTKLPVGQRIQPGPEPGLFQPADPSRQLPGAQQRGGADMDAAIRGGSGGRALPHGWPAGRPFARLAGDAGIVDRIVADMDPVVIRLMRGETVPDATDAQRLAAQTGQYFNMRPFYDALLELGFTPQEALDRVRREATALAATSPRSNTIANQRSAALLQYLQSIAPDGVVSAERIQELLGERRGFNLIRSLHPDLFDRLMRGAGWLEPAPKTSAYGRALGGDLSAVPVDVHNFRAIAMAFNDLRPGQLPEAAFRTPDDYNLYRAAYRPRENGSPPPGMTDEALRRRMVSGPPAHRVDDGFLRDTYMDFHDVTTRIAQRLGVSPAEAQALMWFRYGERTGLRSPPRTAVQILDERIRVTAKLLNMEARDVLALYAQNRIPLAGVGGAATLGTMPGLLDEEPDPDG